ncbi:MAG: hypothetical protein ACHQFZ_01425 [Acidimicrobiales bacterium]
MAIGAIVAAATILGPAAAFAQAPPKATAIYTYNCCGGGLGTHPYHPGQLLAVKWIRLGGHKSRKPAKAVTLAVTATGPFASVAAATSALTKSPPKLGRVNFAAPSLHLTDKEAANPVSQLRIPASAAPGLYGLTIRVKIGQSSASSGLIITVTR